MTVWIMRRLQNPFFSGPTLFRTATVASAGSMGAPPNHRQDDLLRARRRGHALNHGGAIV